MSRCREAGFCRGSEFPGRYRVLKGLVGRRRESESGGDPGARRSTSIPNFVPPGSCTRSEWPFASRCCKKDIAAFNRSSCSCSVLLAAITGTSSRKCSTTVDHSANLPVPWVSRISRTEDSGWIVHNAPGAVQITRPETGAPPGKGQPECQGTLVSGRGKLPLSE